MSTTAPIQIETAWDADNAGRSWNTHPEKGDRRLTVNRADPGDANVVLSFDVKGRRDAIGIPPNEAIKLASAILAAVNVINE